MPQRLSLTGSLLICVLATCGFGSCGKPKQPPPTCPKLSPAPPSLMKAPETGKKVRHELFEPQTSATPKSAGSKP